MKQKAPGKSFREGVTIPQLMKLFPTDEAARIWFEKKLWPHGPMCPYCESGNIQSGVHHPAMTHRCRDCENAGRKARFSLKTRTVMQSSKIGYQKWVIGIYLFATGLKGISSMKMYRDLGVTQKTAWHLTMRIRKAFEQSGVLFSGPVEADETCCGGREDNRHTSKKLNVRGVAGKVVVAGLKDRATNRVMAEVVNATDRPTLQGFVRDYTVPGAIVYTDDALAYRDLRGYKHASVNHSAKEYVNGQAHCNGVESFWSMLKRGGYHGTFHHLSEKYLNRYVGEFAGRHNIRSCDTLTQMGVIAKGLSGKRIRYRDLVGSS